MSIKLTNSVLKNSFPRKSGGSKLGILHWMNKHRGRVSGICKSRNLFSMFRVPNVNKVIKEKLWDRSALWILSKLEKWSVRLQMQITWKHHRKLAMFPLQGRKYLCEFDTMIAKISVFSFWKKNCQNTAVLLSS